MTSFCNQQSTGSKKKCASWSGLSHTSGEGDSWVWSCIREIFQACIPTKTRISNVAEVVIKISSKLLSCSEYTKLFILHILHCDKLYQNTFFFHNNYWDIKVLKVLVQSKINCSFHLILGWFCHGNHWKLKGMFLNLNMDYKIIILDIVYCLRHIQIIQHFGSWIYFCRQMWKEEKGPVQLGPLKATLDHCALNRS